MSAGYTNFLNGINVGTGTSDPLSPSPGDTYYNTSTSKFRQYVNGAWRDLVTADDTQTLTNKTLSGNTASNLVNGSGTLNINSSGTITVPSTTDTLVGKSTTDTLTNKTLTTPIINGSGGQLTLPAGPDTLVGRATTDTLTNKTLTSPVISSIVNTGTLTLPTSTDTLVGRSTTDTLTNKTFGDAPTFTQISTPATPASGYNKIYPKSDGNFYTLNSSGIETQVGSGAGGGLKNYLGTVNNVNGNGNFELGSTTGWSLFNTTLTGVIPTGSISAGASSITTFAVTTSNPLAGTYSLNIASTGAITAGQGFISNAFTLDNEDKAHILAQKFFYEVISGASNLNFSGTSSNTFAVYLYDIANSAWVQPAGVYNLVQNSGVGISTGTFQTASNATQYRLAVICVNASAGASSMLFDDFYVGPQVTAASAAIADLKSYTPTISGTGIGTVSNVNFGYKIIGDYAFVQGYFTTSSTASTAITASLPGTIDSSKLPSSFYSTVGTSNTGTNVNYSFSVISQGGLNTVTFGLQSASSNALTPYTAFGPSTFSFQAMVPITGWSSNTVMSADTDTRVISWNGSAGSGQSVTANTTDITATSINDRTGSWNGSQFKVPVAGDYVVAGVIQLNATFAGAVYLNGSFYNSGYFSTGSSGTTASGTVLVTGCKAGDVLSVRSNATGTIALANLSIFRLSGPATLSASAVVNARYGTISSTVVTNGTPLIFTVKTFDSNLAYSTSTGAYVAPITGQYQFMLTGALSSSGSSDIYFYKNGTSLYYFGSITSSLRCTCVGLVNLLAGDSITLVPQESITINDTSFPSLAVTRCGGVG